MRVTIVNIIGPYDGPYESNILTYKLRKPDGSIIAWHNTNGKNPFPGEVGDTIKGIELTPKGIPNYKKSRPINEQLNLFNNEQR